MSESGGKEQANQRGEPVQPKPSAPRGDVTTPVPARPAHLCPRCDHDLTGLTSRRCPECGSFFTLTSARAHALDKAKAGHRPRRERPSEKRESPAWLALREPLGGALFLIGIALTVLGVLSPAIMDIVSPREIGWLAWCAPFAKTLFRMMIVITLMAPVDAVIAIVAARKGWRWTPTMLLIGILTCIVGALIAMT